jgi:hypothetical protein
MWSAKTGPTLRKPLKSTASASEVVTVQILVPCHDCGQRKRPLSPCPSCHAAPRVDADLSAWRLALHANHLARITARPDREDAEQDRPAPAPLRLVMEVAVDERDLPPDPQIASVAPLYDADGPRSFDWSERRGFRRRRTA